MQMVKTIGFEIAKLVLQVHGTDGMQSHIIPYLREASGTRQGRRWTRSR
jgi:hypothetical protein